uniref:BTB domain-containing protein n=1 Tax=Leersia perrieri TaxID=77586 RepID=A0A0D9XK02_9ORYZ
MTTQASSSVDNSPLPSRSASTIIAARTYHVLKIDGYSSNFLKVKPNDLLDTFTFSAGGRTWYMKYCPNGKSEESKDFIGIYLVLDDNIVEPVMAQVSFSLLDQHGKPVPSYTCTIQLFRFSTQEASANALGFKIFITKEDLERSGHLKDDCFSIGVQLVIAKKTPSIMASPSDMHLHYGNLLSSKRGTDVELIVGGKTFNAHRLVLATRSPVFMAQLFGQMKEGTSVNNVVHIDDMEAQVFEILLNFIYTYKLQEMDQEDEVAMTQHLIVAADKYDLKRLKKNSEVKLTERTPGFGHGKCPDGLAEEIFNAIKIQSDIF